MGKAHMGDGLYGPLRIGLSLCYAPLSIQVNHTLSWEIHVFFCSQMGLDKFVMSCRFTKFQNIKNLNISHDLNLGNKRGMQAIVV
jgi:hypothetical protein